jgi:hypothetical protein
MDKALLTLEDAINTVALRECDVNNFVPSNTMKKIASIRADLMTGVIKADEALLLLDNLNIVPEQSN